MRLPFARNVVARRQGFRKTPPACHRTGCYFGHRSRRCCPGEKSPRRRNVHTERRGKKDGGTAPTSKPRKFDKIGLQVVHRDHLGSDFAALWTVCDRCTPLVVMA